MNRSLESMLHDLFLDHENDVINQELAEQIVAAYPKRAEALAARARVYYRLDDYERAETDVRAALAIDADCPEAIRVHAYLLQDAHDNAEEADRVLDAALSKHPNDYGLLLARGYSAMIAGDNDNAIRLLTRACQVQPLAVKGLGNLVHVCPEADRIDDLLNAVRIVESARALKGQECYNVGTALYQGKRNQEALTYLDRGRELLGEQNAIQHNRALCLEALGRHQEAIDEWSNLLLREPDWDWPREGRIRCNRELGNVDAAMSDIAYLNKLDPQNQNGRQELASILYEKDDFSGAIRVLDALIADECDGAWERNLRGSSYHRLKQLSDARSDYLRAIEIDDTYPQALRNLAKVELEEGRPAEALKYAEMAISVSPDSWTAHDLRGQALTALGQKDAAASVYARWLEKHPDDKVARESYGLHLLETARYKEALRELQRVVDPLNPGGYLCWSIGECHKGLKNTAAAREWYQKARTRYALQNNQHSVTVCDDAIKALDEKKGLLSRWFG